MLVAPTSIWMLLGCPYTSGHRLLHAAPCEQHHKSVVRAAITAGADAKDVRWREKAERGKEKWKGGGSFHGKRQKEWREGEQEDMERYSGGGSYRARDCMCVWVCIHAYLCVCAGEQVLLQWKQCEEDCSFWCWWESVRGTSLRHCNSNPKCLFGEGVCPLWRSGLRNYSSAGKGVFQLCSWDCRNTMSEESAIAYWL